MNKMYGKPEDAVIRVVDTWKVINLRLKPAEPIRDVECKMIRGNNYLDIINK